MSWYVGQDGRKVWAGRDDLVFTVGEVDGALPLVTLTYLSTNMAKPVFAEHVVEDDIDGRKGQKKKEKMGGRQRGFVVRVDQDDKNSRVMSTFRPVADQLVNSGLVARIDVDSEGTGGSSRKKKAKEAAENAAAAADGEQAAEKSPMAVSLAAAPLAVNECRLETTARCKHNAHGSGWRLEVAEVGVLQRLHVFAPPGKTLGPEEWRKGLCRAIEATGSRLALGRLMDETPPDAQNPTGKTPEAGSEEAAWLEALLGRCCLNDDSKGAAKKEGQAGEVAEPSEASASAPKKSLPPWLRRH